MQNSQGSDLIALNVFIENFRCIRRAKIDLEQGITVFIGKNGSGKTSILDAIALGMKNFQSAWEVASTSRQMLRAERIDLDEVFRGADFSAVDVVFQSTDLDIFGPSQIKIGSYTDRARSQESFSSLVSRISKFHSSFHKPLFIYYGQGRAFESYGRPSRQKALSEDSLDGDLRAISDLEAWWDQRDAEEARTVRDKAQPDFRDTQLQAIRSLVRRIEGFKDIFYSSSMKPQGLYFRKDNGFTIHVSKLSSGERSYIILLADLARRLQLSSPDRDLADIPGIVLIDEIELNLHPAWQSEVVPTIRDVFRSCQFIITTHSPQVISAVESQNVRVVRRSENGELGLDMPLSTRGRSSNYLLEGVFDASERLPEVDRMFSEFNDAIDDNKVTDAEKILDGILLSIEGSPPDILVLKKRLKALQNKK